VTAKYGSRGVSVVSRMYSNHILCFNFRVPYPISSVSNFG